MKVRLCHLLILSLITFSQSSYAQPKHDQQWMLGALSGSLLDFSNDTLTFSLADKTLRQDAGVASMCNESGQLLFYSNGCRIANADHEIMENGDGLNVGSTLDFFCEPDLQGDPVPQSLIALPRPDQLNEYFLIYQDMHAGLLLGNPPQSSVEPLHLQFARINMEANNGLGTVLEKNQVIIEDTLSTGFLQSVRHANGRDWWIISPRAVSNCYYTTLLSPTGFDVMSYQCLGNEWNNIDLAGQSVFSSNGERYVRSHSDNGLDIFDFDRCTGELSNPIHISLVPDTNVVCNGMAISPNSRFVYTSIFHKVYQFDLDATDIAASKILIAEWDGYSNPNPTNFCLSELAPDGKIYISSFGPTFNLHVIHQPDSLGLACNLIQHDFSVENDSTVANILMPGMPSHPNYSLGPIEGSPCDTIEIIDAITEQAQTQIQIAPNPGEGLFQIRTGLKNINSLRVFDLTGRTVRSNTHLKNGNIDLRMYPDGIYFVQITLQSGRHHLTKLVKSAN